MDYLDEYGLNLIKGVNNVIVNQRLNQLHTINSNVYAKELLCYPTEVMNEMQVYDRSMLDDLESYERWLTNYYVEK